jgi:hypothetical protein
MLTDGGFEALPEADLLIAKDVLQHLDTRRIQWFLAATERYPRVLVTNTMDPAGRTNAVIQNGQFRPVDLRLKPFSIPTTVVFAFWGTAGARRCTSGAGAGPRLTVAARAAGGYAPAP